MPLTTVTGFTAEHMAEIEGQCIIHGAVDLAGHLQLTTVDGTVIDAGSVKGPQGDIGPMWALPGMMFNYAAAAVPSGYLNCDGSNLLRTAYSALYAAIGTRYGSADSTHFYLPDNRGWKGISATAVPVPNATFVTINGFTTDSSFINKEGQYYHYDNTTGQFTFITPGLWDVYGQVVFPSESVGGRYIVRLLKNGTERARFDSKSGYRNEQQVFSISKVLLLNAGDILELQAYQETDYDTVLSTSPPNHVLEIRPKDMGDIIKY